MYAGNICKCVCVCMCVCVFVCVLNCVLTFQTFENAFTIYVFRVAGGCNSKITMCVENIFVKQCFSSCFNLPNKVYI